ncbi:MAG: hypothetical protein CM15mP115_17940 [Alphaproteobacteria bacterium]|nr:MAG: hypothetical protein CM15mP115_17940 [Alphaproteobacteria bacterium]
MFDPKLCLAKNSQKKKTQKPRLERVGGWGPFFPPKFFGLGEKAPENFEPGARRETPPKTKGTLPSKPQFPLSPFPPRDPQARPQAPGGPKPKPPKIQKGGNFALGPPKKTRPKNRAPGKPLFSAPRQRGKKENQTRGGFLTRREKPWFFPNKTQPGPPKGPWKPPGTPRGGLGPGPGLFSRLLSKKKGGLGLQVLGH